MTPTPGTLRIVSMLFKWPHDEGMTIGGFDNAEDYLNATADAWQLLIDAVNETDEPCSYECDSFAHVEGCPHISPDVQLHLQRTPPPQGRSETMTPEELRKAIEGHTASDWYGELFNLRIAARSAADAWQRHIDRMNTAEADRHELLARIEALEHDLVLMRTDRDAAEYHVEALQQDNSAEYHIEALELDLARIQNDRELWRGEMGVLQCRIEVLEKDLAIRLAKAFKKWIVRRPDGGCQVLLPLSELDATFDAALAWKE